VDEAGSARGQFRATGIRPKCLEKLETAGVSLPLEMFEQRVLDA
jgi:pilus assembly protein CpaF